jgi:hypothetical protein
MIPAAFRASLHAETASFLLSQFNMLAVAASVVCRNGFGEGEVLSVHLFLCLSGGFAGSGTHIGCSRISLEPTAA